MGWRGRPSSRLPLEAPMMSPGVQHMLKGSLVNMEGDQGGQGVLKPPVGSSISEEIGTLRTLPLSPPPPRALSTRIPRGFGITRLSPAPRKPQASVEPGDWPSIILISRLWRPQVPGLDGPRGPGGRGGGGEGWGQGGLDNKKSSCSLGELQSA